MRFWYDNLIDYAAVVITSSSFTTGLPATNLAHDHRKKVWRTGNASAAEWVVFDLGSAKSVTAVILLDHTLTNADTLIKVEGNTADSWGAPAFSQTLTWAAALISQVFASQSYRYWRVSFTKSAAGETRDIGRVFLGTYYETEEQPDYSGFDREKEDNSRVFKSLGGQTYVDKQDQFYTFSATFSTCPNTQVESFQTIFERVGRHTSFFVQSDTVSPLDKIYYVKFTEDFDQGIAAFDSQFYWNTSLDMEEQL